jgi:hypothetical protein
MYNSASVKNSDLCLVILELIGLEAKVVWEGYLGYVVVIELGLVGWGLVEFCCGICCMFLSQGHGQKGCVGVMCDLKHL